MQSVPGTAVTIPDKEATKTQPWEAGTLQTEEIHYRHSGSQNQSEKVTKLDLRELGS